MRTKNFKHLSSLSKSCEQLTLQNIINGRAYFKQGGWGTFTFELSENQMEQIVDLIGGHTKTKRNVKWSLQNQKPQHWGLDRIVYNQRSAAFTYIAGQDYPSELREIRKAMK